MFSHDHKLMNVMLVYIVLMYNLFKKKLNNLFIIVLKKFQTKIKTINFDFL